MHKILSDEIELKNFRSKATDLLEATDIDAELDRHFEIINQKIDEFVRNGVYKILNN